MILRMLLVLCLLLGTHPSFSKVSHQNLSQQENESKLSLTQGSEQPSSSPLPVDAVVIPKEEVEAAKQWMQNCHDFSTACQRRNGLLEAYKVEADKLIDHQAQRNAQLDAEVSKHKRTNHYLYPLLGIAAGFLGGSLLLKK